MVSCHSGLVEKEMKRLLLIACLVMVPVSFMFALWQSYSYQMVEAEVATLEKQRQALFEANKRLVARYGEATSPALIEERARQELGMARPGQDQVVRLGPATGDGE